MEHEKSKNGKTWPKTYLALPKRWRRLINNFMSSRLPDGDKAETITNFDNYHGNQANWNYDCRIYGAPSKISNYSHVRSNYCKYGSIPENEG